MKKLVLIGMAFAMLLPMTAAARGRFGVFVGPSFGPYGWYGPYAFGPYAYGPFYPYGPAFGTPNAGEVKLDTKLKDAEVFVNGNYAGTVRELKSMTMRPGDYSIEIRDEGRTTFQQDIHVIAGKTMKLHPDLQLEEPPSPHGS